MRMGLNGCQLVLLVVIGGTWVCCKTFNRNDLKRKTWMVLASRKKATSVGTACWNILVPSGSSLSPKKFSLHYKPLRKMNIFLWALLIQKGR